MAETHAQNKPVHIAAGADGERDFVLHPADNDLFVRTGKQVIAACELGISVELWLRELHGMFDKVAQWTKERDGRISDCWCAPRGTRTMFFFVPRAGRFDFDLADELATLNSELLKSFNIGMVEVHQVPRSELERFIDTATAKHVYGDPGQPHYPVEA